MSLNNSAGMLQFVAQARFAQIAASTVSQLSVRHETAHAVALVSLAGGFQSKFALIKTYQLIVFCS